MSNSPEINPFAIKLPTAVATNVEQGVALAANASLEQVAELVRQLAKSAAQMESNVANLKDGIHAIWGRIMIAEQQLRMLQWMTKPAWQTLSPMPYYPPPGLYIEPWQVPSWRPGTMWCGEQEQGKLSG